MLECGNNNFVKPAKENLVVYELLVRDFDANRSQDLINKIDYFKNLKINAIELMPVMEFEGNELGIQYLSHGFG
jgi:1,4-alpha-glucan branching enzyme